jgi:hypothetical protein
MLRVPKRSVCPTCVRGRIRRAGRPKPAIDMYEGPKACVEKLGPTNQFLQDLYFAKTGANSHGDDSAGSAVAQCSCINQRCGKLHGRAVGEALDKATYTDTHGKRGTLRCCRTGV